MLWKTTLNMVVNSVFVLRYRQYIGIFSAYINLPPLKCAILFMVFLVTLSCNNSNMSENAELALKSYKQENYKEALNYLEKVDFNKEIEIIKLQDIRYKCYKNILSEVFNWDGRVEIIDKKFIEKGGKFEEYQKYLNGFEDILTKDYQKGIIAGINFRLGNFKKAFYYYQELYLNYNYQNIFPYSRESILKDLEASLIGILLQEKFSLEEYYDLYYHREDSWNKIDMDSLSYENIKLVDSFLEMKKNLPIITSKIKDEKSLTAIIERYTISENEIVDIYQIAIKNKDFVKAEIVAYKLENKYKRRTKFEEIWFTYKQEKFDKTLSLISSFEKSKIEDSEIRNILNIIELYSNFNLKKYSKIIDVYVQIEEFNLFPENKVNDNDWLYSFEYINDLGLIKNIISSLIRKEIISERKILSVVNQHPGLAVSLNEMLFQKYLFKGEYGRAYSLSKKMKERLYYGNMIDFKTFEIISEILEIITNSNNDSFLQKLKLKTFDEILLTGEQTIKNYASNSNVLTEGYYMAVRAQFNSTIQKIKLNIKEDSSRNVFEFIETNKYLFNENIEFLSSIKSSTNLIFSNKVDITGSRFTIDGTIPGFFDYGDGWLYSKLHYNLIKLNIILEVLENNYSDDYIYMFSSIFFKKITPRYYFINKQDDQDVAKIFKKKINNCITQIRIKKKSDIEREYYADVRDRILKKSKYFAGLGLIEI